MRLLSYIDPLRGPSYGVAGELGAIHDLGADNAAYAPTLRHFVTLGDWRKRADEALAHDPVLRIGDPGLVLLPPIMNPGKIICVGLNYDDHRKETGRAVVDHPTLFTRFADTLVGHDTAIVAPKNSDQLDYEGELAVIIGKTARHIAEESALDHVAGYACFNDGSVRDWQYQTSQFTPGKNFPRSGAFGPWMVTADEIPDPQALELTLRLNGAVMQQTTTDKMIFPVVRIIAYISAFTELAPGDVIATGTPAGVGSKRVPPVFLKPGDSVEVEISGIGTLRNPLTGE